jgi:methylmalonyl-CoA mutase
MESLTQQLAMRALEHIREVEELGGMTKAIERGIPKMRIEQAAARKQARIDSGQDHIIGVNLFRTDDAGEFEILEVDNTAVREEQIRRLQALRAGRDGEAAAQRLAALTAIARGEREGNLLAAAVDAARARATLGEISDALELAFGRYSAAPVAISGVFAKAMGDNEDYKTALALSDRFAEAEGRRPRILIAKLGQDGHDRGARVIATSFADLGFDVDIGPLFQTPEEAARQAVENDVHILGISSLAAGHKTLVPQAIQALKELGREDIMLVVGGVIPPQDYDTLRAAGVDAIFGPGTVIARAASEILRKLLDEGGGDGPA